jgi:hypothetical protein
MCTARWAGGAQSLALPGVRWLAPRGAPSNQEVVYVAKDASGIPAVYVLESATGQTRLINRLRSAPVFLNSRVLWYRGEQPCAAGDPMPCPAESTRPSGVTYVYDLTSGVESQSIITDVWDVWPHPA